MGCCGSKSGETQEQIEPDQTKKRFRLISVKKPVKVPSPPAWNVSDDSGPEISLPAKSFSIPMPPLTKKPSSPTIRRRSGVRLALSETSPSQKDGTESVVQVHPLPSPSTGSVRTPRPPTGKKCASPVIKRRSGVRIVLASSLNNLRAEGQSRPITPEVADETKSSLSKEDIQAAPEASQSFADMTEVLPSTSEPASAETDALTPSVESVLIETVCVSKSAEDSKPPQAEGKGHLTMEDDKCLVPEQSVRKTSEDVALAPEVTSAPHFKEERQVFQGFEEQREGIEEALGQSSGLGQPSFEPQANNVLEDVPCTSVSEASTVEQPQRDQDNFKSSLELDIEKAASVLVAQALRNAVAEVDSERASHVIEDDAFKAIMLPQVIEPVAVAKSDHAHLEPAKSTQDDVDKLAKMLAQQAIEAASMDLGIPLEPAFTSKASDISAAHCSTQDDIDKLAKKLAQQAIEAASMDLGIPLESAYTSEASDIISVAHCCTQVQNIDIIDGNQVAKIARIMSAKAIESAIHSVTNSGNDAVIHDSTPAKLADNIAANAKPTDAHEVPRIESDEELIVRGIAIIIPKVTKTQKASGSSKNVKTRAPVKKTKNESPNKKSRSVGTVAVKPQVPPKKKNFGASALGKSRSVGAVTIAKTTENTTKKINRSLSLNTVVKSTIGTAAMGNKKSSPPKTGRPVTTAKKPMPMKTESKPRRAEHTFRAAKTGPPKKTLPAKGGNNLPAVAVKKASTSHTQLSRDKKASSKMSNISEKVQVSRKTSNGLAGASSFGSSKDKRAEERKPDKKTVKSSRTGAIKKKSLISDEGQKKAMDLVSFQSTSSQELSTKSSSSLLQVAVKSHSEKAIDGKSIPKVSNLPSPKSQSLTTHTTAWVNEMNGKHAILHATSPSMSPKGSSLSVTGRSSPRKSRNSSPFGSCKKISVDKIPSSSPIRIRSGSSNHLQEL